MGADYSIVVARVPDGYRLSINGEDYVYSTLRDVQQRVAALVWPDPEHPLVEVSINFLRGGTQ